MRAIWRFSLIGIILCLLSCQLMAQTSPDMYADAEAIIPRADAHGSKQNFDAAIALLKKGINQYPAYTRLYQSMLVWQEMSALAEMSKEDKYSKLTRDQLKVEFRKHLDEYPAAAKSIFETLGQATMFVPSLREIDFARDGFLRYQYPVQLGENGLLALPGEPTFYTYTLTDRLLPAECRGTRTAMINSIPLPPTPYYALDPRIGAGLKGATDPAYEDRLFTRMLVVYDYDKASSQWNLRFRVMWQDLTEEGDGRFGLAMNTARMLIRLNWLLDAYTGMGPLFAKNSVINVWLSETGEAGGEAQGDNLFLYKISVERSPLEWLREVAHEYGHLTLPVVGGYEQPEWGANGRLGERLFMRWIARNPDIPENQHPWALACLDKDVRDNRIDLLMKQFAASGPETIALKGVNSAAMDGFVGMALYIESTRGSRTLTDILQGMNSPAYIGVGGSMGFLQSVQYHYLLAQTAEKPVVTLNLRDLPAELTLWVCLREGNWRGEIDTTDGKRVKMKAEVNGKAVKVEDTGVFTLTGLTVGWQRILIMPVDKTEALNLAQLRLIKF